VTNRNKTIFLATLITLTAIAAFAFIHAINSEPLPATPAFYDADSIDSPPLQQTSVDIVEPINDQQILSKYPQLTTILANDNQADVIKELEILLAKVSANDLKDIAFYLAQLSQSHPHYQISNLLVIQYWSTLSANKAFTFSINHLPEPVKFNAISTVLKTHCKVLTEVTDCLDSLNSLHNFDKNLISTSKTALENSNFSDAILWASAIDNEISRTQLIDSISRQWIDNDAEQAFLWAVSNNNYKGLANNAILNILNIDAWRAYSLVTQIADTHSEQRSELYTVIVNSLVTRGDFLTVMSILESASQHETIAGVARKWIEADPRSALEWSLSYEDFYSMALRAIDELTQKDHQQAFEITLLVPNSRSVLRKDMFNSIFSDRAQNKDFETIMALIKRLPPQENAEEYYDNFITQWSWENPQAAVNAVLKLPNSPKKAQLITNTINAWAEKTPKEAAALLQRLEDNSLRESAITGILEGWTINEAEAASQWLSSQPSSNELDNSIASASERLLRTQKDKTVIRQLARQISNEELRASTLNAIDKHVFSEFDSDLNE